MNSKLISKHFLHFDDTLDSMIKLCVCVIFQHGSDSYTKREKKIIGYQNDSCFLVKIKMEILSIKKSKMFPVGLNFRFNRKTFGFVIKPLNAKALLFSIAN